MTENKPQSSISGRTRWALILFEIALCYSVVYVSAYLNWPKHDYFRFAVLLPLYQAGLAFGYTGGIISSIVATLLFMPLLPTDPMITGNPGGEIPSAIGMIVFMNFFGIFVGSYIGIIRKTQRNLQTLSQVSYNIAQETSERGIMRQLSREALSLLETQYAAVLIRENGRPDSMRWTMSGISSDNPGGEDIADFDHNHPLVWAAREKSFLVTNSAASDERFQACPREGALKSILVVPVVSQDTVYGALLISDKKTGDLFNDKDISMARLLADTAVDTIHNLEQEKKRQEQKARESQMKELFSRYVSSSIADYVLDNPRLLKGRWQEVTILVSDIRDFTLISETLKPSRMVEQLNEYFTSMVDVIFKNDGTIDKFVGDCIIAYWGAPVPDTEHPLHAARAAVEMVHALEKLNKQWAASGKPAFKTGIALHTCRVLMGNLGDDRKKVFTIMGEEVENAISFESLTKDYNAGIIVSEQTSKSISGEFTLERLPDRETDNFGALYKVNTV